MGYTDPTTGAWIYEPGDPDGPMHEVLNKQAEAIGAHLADVDQLVLDAYSGALITEIANEPAVLAAAAALAQDDAGLVTDGDPRLPAEGDAATFRIRDKAGYVGLEATSTGVRVGPVLLDYERGIRMPDADGDSVLEVTRDGMLRNGTTLIDPAFPGYRIRDKAGRVAFQIDANGNVTGNGLGGAPATSRVIILAQAGQSLGEGRGRPYGPQLDPTDPRILMYDWTDSSLDPATVPLSSRQQQTGLSPATVLARELLRYEPPGLAVVIVNGAVGGSGLVATPAQGTWALGATGSLYDAFEAAYLATRAQIALPNGAQPETILLWNQGEAEADVDQATYAAALDALIARFRTAAGASTPVVLGGMVPEWVAANGREPIRRAHVDTPRRLEMTAYAPMPPNAGGSSSPTDLVHASREGIEILGAREHDAYRRALANVATSVPDMPTWVEATVIDGVLTVRWSEPFSRVTAYTIEHRIDGGTWTPLAHDGIDTSLVAPVASGFVEVRMAVTNPVGTSSFTAPTPAIGA